MQSSRTTFGGRNGGIVEALSRLDKPALKRYLKASSHPNLDHIPGGGGMPVIGHMYWALKDFSSWLNKQYAEHGSVFKFRTPMGNNVVLLGPEANRLVLQNEGKVFSNYFAYEPGGRDLLFNHLLEMDFANHKATRKMLQAAFKRKAIEGHMELMNPLLKEGISQWRTGQSIKAFDHVKKLLLDTGATVFLGVDIGREADMLNQAFTDLLGGGRDPLRKKEIWFSPFAKGLRGRAILEEFVFKNIPERRRMESRDIFSQLCHARDEEGNLFSDEEIRDHIIFVLFAAQDTTTSVLSAALYSLASNQDWQDEIRQEINALNTDAIEFDHIERLEKTSWTFKEALRMHPPLSMMPRFALEEFECNGVRIPKNTNVIVSALFTHYMPEYWSNPDKFDPLRFSPDRAEDKKDFFQYVPFGGGAHKCLGLHFAETQGKMFLFHLLKQYRVIKNPKLTQFKTIAFPLTHSTDGLPLTFTKI
jgi:cytochrome P450